MRHRPANPMALVEAKHAGVSISSAELADPLFVVVLDSVETPIRGPPVRRRPRQRRDAHPPECRAPPTVEGRVPPRAQGAVADEARGTGAGCRRAGHRDEDARGGRGEGGCARERRLGQASAGASAASAGLPPARASPRAGLPSRGEPPLPPVRARERERKRMVGEEEEYDKWGPLVIVRREFKQFLASKGIMVFSQLCYPPLALLSSKMVQTSK